MKEKEMKKGKNLEGEEEEQGKEEEQPKGEEEKKGREGIKVKVRRKEGRKKGQETLPNIQYFFFYTLNKA